MKKVFAQRPNGGVKKSENVFRDLDFLSGQTLLRITFVSLNNYYIYTLTFTSNTFRFMDSLKDT